MRNWILWIESRARESAIGCAIIGTMKAGFNRRGNPGEDERGVNLDLRPCLEKRSGAAGLIDEEKHAISGRLENRAGESCDVGCAMTLRRKRRKRSEGEVRSHFRQ